MKPQKNRGRAGRRDLPFVDPVFAEEMSLRGDGHEEFRHRKPDYKTMQLCRQVQRALSLTLAGECNDDVLRGVYVESVVPAPDATHLLVRVIVPPANGPATTLAQVLQSLESAKGTLRAAVARAITRKRAPELSFLPLVEEEVQP